MRAVMLVALAMLAGCASGTADPAKYASMSCEDLNIAVGSSAAEISATARTRGRIDRANVPFWVPGGTKVVTTLRNRQSREIDRLQAQQAGLIDTRNRTCLKDK